MTDSAPIIYSTRDAVLGRVKELVLPVSVVMDVGPGICPQTFVNACTSICAEPFLPYIEKLRGNLRDDPRYVFLNCTWDKAMALLPDASVDTVFALDVIEHLEKEEGRRLLSEAQRIARRQVVIFTPLGFNPQSYDDPAAEDRWGMRGGHWQTHRSGWSPEEFAQGWRIVCCEDFHTVDQHEQALDKPTGAFWAVWNNPGQAAGENEDRRNVPDTKRIESAWMRYIQMHSVPPTVRGALRQCLRIMKRACLG